MQSIASYLGLPAGFAGILAVLAMPVAGQDGWRQLNGKPVPEIRATEWLNAGGKSVDRDTLKGKVWLLEFFATT